MSVHFFIEDESKLIVYDYDLSVSGALTVSPMFFHRTEDVTLVVLRRAENGPTAAQLQRIAQMKAEYPNEEMRFHFARPLGVNRPEAPKKRSRNPVAVISDWLTQRVRRELAN